MKTKICFSIFILLSVSNLQAQINNFDLFTTYNYIYSKTNLLITAGGNDYRENFRYYDGLGRLSQTVDYKGSPNQKDMIQPVEYDPYGREAINYLPYTATATAASGVFRSAWKTDQSTFHISLYGSADGPKAFAQTIFDNSPLNRAMKQGAPGDAWKIVNTTPVRQSSEHIISYQYTTNSANEVYYWTISGAYPNITFARYPYAANTLYKNIVYDENNNPITKYKDKHGKVMLTTDALGGKTYYIYDDFELLRCVIPPLASLTLVTAASFTLSNNDCKELCFYYEYDERHRMIKKKIPGTNEVYAMTYDNLDRLIQTIDPIGTPNGTRSYTEYDNFSRPIVSGIYVGGVKTWQTKIYYDRYNPDTDYSTTYPYLDIYGITRETSVKGKVTVTINKVINPAGDMRTELVSVTYYDKYGRIIQTVSDNHKNGRDRISYKYKYKNSDAVDETRYDHGISGTTVSHTIIEKFEYDHAGRLKTTKHKIDTQAETTLATISYNEAGQLLQKGINGIQAVDYKYNIRNWLTNINNPDEYSSNDLFSQRLSYTGNSYNGNITKMEWTNPSAGLVKAYEFGYDKLNRVTSCAYLEYDHGVYLPGSTGKYVETYIYDANGNIKSAQRNGIIDDGTGLIGTIDVLNYKYYNSDKSNRLWAIGDFIPDVIGRGDFNELNSDGFASQEYLYDNNGNMYRDYNKKSNIFYNYLNLPYRVIDLNGNAILYFNYSAGGIKLRQQISMGTTFTIGTYDYIGHFIYKNGVLDYIITSEGRAVCAIGNFSYYEFHMKDHLGNVRTVFKKNGSVPQVLQKNDYYPFGMLMGESTGENFSNKYLYNGKEQVNAISSGYGVDLSMYDYGARFYDPQIGRYHVQDPLTDFMPGISPYSYAYNNPIGLTDVYGMWPDWWPFKKREGSERRHNPRKECKPNKYKPNGSPSRGKSQKNQHNSSGSGTSSYTYRPPSILGPAEEEYSMMTANEDIPAGDLKIPDLIPVPPKYIYKGQDIIENPNITEDIRFKPDVAEFYDLETTEEVLAELVKILIASPGLNIYIAGNIGSTDNTAIYGYNQTALNQQWKGYPTARDLMNARALAVYNFLIKKGIDPKRLIPGPGGVIRGSSGRKTSFEFRWH